MSLFFSIFGGVFLCWVIELDDPECNIILPNEVSVPRYTKKLSTVNNPANNFSKTRLKNIEQKEIDLKIQ